MTSLELSILLAYFRVEPPAPHRDDVRAAAQTMHIVNAIPFRKRPVQLSDVLLRFDRDPEREMTDEEQTDYFEALAARGSKDD